MKEEKIVCIDLDGTIAYYDEWRGEEHFGDPLPGVKDVFKILKNNKWIIIIYTTRANKKLVSEYLNKNGIQFDFINENPYQPVNAKGGKLYANVYIDDKTISFNGNWQGMIEKIEKFKPWTEMENMGKNYEKDRLELAREFLNHDFNQSYEQLRHYDNLSWDITKFSFIELLVGIAAVWAIYGFAINPENPPTLIKEHYRLLIPSIFGLCYVFSILASFLISRNRVYFSKVAKYLNEHRRFSLSTKPAGFENETKFYTNTKFPPAYDKWSTHIVSLYVIQLVSSIMFCSMIYCILLEWIENENLLLLLSIFFGALSFFTNMFVYIRYMKKQDPRLGS